MSVPETSAPRRANGEALGLACAIGQTRANYTRMDFRAVAAAALTSVDSVLRHWLPDGRRDGHEYKALNPTRSDNRRGSFSINVNSGAWADFATGDKGGDLVSLVAYLDGTNQGTAGERLSNFLGLAGTHLHINQPGQPGQPGQTTEILTNRAFRVFNLHICTGTQPGHAGTLRNQDVSGRAKCRARCLPAPPRSARAMME